MLNPVNNLKTARQNILMIGIIVFLIVAIPLPSPVYAVEDVLTLGVFPRQDAKTTTKAFTPLVTYLSKKLNRKVILKMSFSYSNFWQDVKEKRYDIVHYNQYHYVKSHVKFGYDVFAMNEEQGKSKITSGIYSIKNSGITKPEDIKGKIVAFGGGPKSMVSYILPLHTLKKLNIASHEFKSIFAKNPPNAVLSVLFNTSDLAAVGTPVLLMPKITRSPDASNLQELAVSEAIVHLPWAYSSELPQELKRKIKEIYINLHTSEEGKQILKKAKVTNFLEANDADYNRVREIIFEVIGVNYQS